ncbi:hypothetical protein KC19_2G094100 [Ceratodon purpureus]|uniref:Uncharacterized protein n=1 Tax=Ceratodon purpureus TaxID=3225 RepID=A0A8T0ITJ6_CERPU|nr:hypothetical protein KC19_2G094100 [Ceratodon purpureus]
MTLLKKPSCSTSPPRSLPSFKSPNRIRSETAYKLQKTSILLNKYLVAHFQFPFITTIRSFTVASSACITCKASQTINRKSAIFALAHHCSSTIQQRCWQMLRFSHNEFDDVIACGKWTKQPHHRPVTHTQLYEGNLTQGSTYMPAAHDHFLQKHLR